MMFKNFLKFFEAHPSNSNFLKPVRSQRGLKNIFCFCLDEDLNQGFLSSRKV